MVPWPSGKARVCKTLIPRFKSGCHLQKNNHIEKMWLFFCLNAFMGAGDWIPPVPAFLFQRNHPHGGKALPRNRTAKNTAPLAYAIRLRGRVPADAALTKMDGKMADFFGEKDS